MFATLKAYRRVIGLDQVFYLAGSALRRMGVKYTTAAAGLAGLLALAGLIGSHLARWNLTPPQMGVKALWLPGMTALATFGLGNLFIAISHLFSSTRLMMASANSLNLMEDRKKADMDHHLEILWQRVFRYEAQLQHNPAVAQYEANRLDRCHEHLQKCLASWPEEIRNDLGINPDNLDELCFYIQQFRPLSNRLEATGDGFDITAHYGLTHHLPQKLQRQLIGFDLSLLEDWYDGAFFSANDCKLKEQFAANSLLRSIRRQVGMSWLERLREATGGVSDPLWHTLTMKKIGASVGNLIDRFNHQYCREDQSDFFDAQDFLWPHPENEAALKKACGPHGPEVLEQLTQARRTLFCHIFSDSKSQAHRQIFAMFGRDFINALTLRLKFDVEFAGGLLDSQPLADCDQLSELTCGPVCAINRCTKAIERARAHLEQCSSFLQREQPAIMEHPEQLRAVRVGWHINTGQIRQLASQSPAKALSVVHGQIIPARPRLAEQLCALRSHYELTRIQLFSYCLMVDTLAQYE